MSWRNWADKSSDLADATTSMDRVRGDAAAGSSDTTAIDDGTEKGTQPEPNAPELPIEAAIADTPPSDDSDLANTGEEQEPVS